ncbi:hypothetical protein JTE90_018897, partial [Oedothorax gibbosus]
PKTLPRVGGLQAGFTPGPSTQGHRDPPTHGRRKPPRGEALPKGAPGVIGPTWSAHPFFRGLVASVGELLKTLLSKFRLPGHRPDCLEQPPPFRGVSWGVSHGTPL